MLNLQPSLLLTQPRSEQQQSNVHFVWQDASRDLKNTIHAEEEGSTSTYMLAGARYTELLLLLPVYIREFTMLRIKHFYRDELDVELLAYLGRLGT